MYKDRLPEIIQAFSELSKTRRDFEFKVYGITRDQFLRGAPEKAPEIDQIGNCLSFHGRVSHSASLDALSQSHFSIFLRKSNRVSNAGFPTKYMEASTIGVPVIANITSDIGQFLSHGRNGFVVEGFDPAQVLQTLREAMSLNENEYKEMRDRQLENDPFSVENWKFKMKEFLRLSGMRIS